jgi:hypothetical protein
VTGSNRSRSTSGGRRGDNGRASSPAALARVAAAELGDLLGRDPEGIVGLERTDDGWLVVASVLEVHRIPETADVLADYEIDADEEGHLTGYRRVRRYVRGRVEEQR